MAPVAVVGSVIISAITSAIVAAFKWLVNHIHVVKIVGVCLLIAGAFKVGRLAYNTLVGALATKLAALDSAAPSGVSATTAFLAKANYVLPLSEMFALLAVYVVIAGICMSLKCIIAGYKAIPFKSA